jgi:hypothetical protein
VTLGQILDEDLGMHGEAAWVAVSGIRWVCMCRVDGLSGYCACCRTERCAVGRGKYSSSSMQATTALLRRVLPVAAGVHVHLPSACASSCPAACACGSM